MALSRRWRIVLIVVAAVLVAFLAFGIYGVYGPTSVSGHTGTPTRVSR